MPVRLWSAYAKLVYQGRRIKVKVTGTKNWIYDRIAKWTFAGDWLAGNFIIIISSSNIIEQIKLQALNIKRKVEKYNGCNGGLFVIIVFYK